jgi:enoyl-CoA hydratase/carnithine racemase
MSDFDEEFEKLGVLSSAAMTWSAVTYTLAKNAYPVLWENDWVAAVQTVYQDMVNSLVMARREMGDSAKKAAEEIIAEMESLNAEIKEAIASGREMGDAEIFSVKRGGHREFSDDDVEGMLKDVEKFSNGKFTNPDDLN